MRRLQLLRRVLPRVLIVKNSDTTRLIKNDGERHSNLILIDWQSVVSAYWYRKRVSGSSSHTIDLQITWLPALLASSLPLLPGQIKEQASPNHLVAEQ